jgi:trigger factor
MPDTDNLPPPDADLNSDDASVALEGEGEMERMDLDVKIDTRSTCERHVTVVVPREDIERYYNKEFSELMPTAHVPGFRPGRAPRKLIETRFRKDITPKVKSELLMSALTQVNEEQKMSVISEPNFDVEAIEMPAEGSFTFEFDIEVRPEFEMPQWKGLQIEKPTREFTEADVERELEDILARRGRLVPHEGPAALGDYITTNLTLKHGDQELAHGEEEVIRIRRVLSFHDGKIPDFDKLMDGVRGGETRVGEARLSDDAPNVALRGQAVSAIFEVLEVKRLEVPELTPELLGELGRFRDEAELRDTIRDQLGRQLEYEQHQRAREQITKALTVAANWELPPAMLQRQSQRELQRAVMELQRSGFSEEQIRAHENALRQNSRSVTAQALKEHFILERIAEEEEIDANDADYEREIELIAANANESARRVRARLEKSSSMDVLRNQIIERKVIQRILEHARFKEVPYDILHTDEEAVNHAAGGGEQSEIPEAKYDEGPEVPEAKGAGEQKRRHGSES